MKLKRFATAPALLLVVSLAACAASLDEQSAFAAPAPNAWPPAWQDTPATPPGAFTPPHFEPPSAQHCQRAPTTREVPGRSTEENAAAWHLRKDSGDKLRAAPPINALTIDSPAPKAAATAAARAEPERRAVAATGRVAPAQQAPEPVDAVVTAGVVDDNADFGAYLAYRERNTKQPVRERELADAQVVSWRDLGSTRAAPAQPLSTRKISRP